MKIQQHEDASSIWLKYKDGLKHYILKMVRDDDLANELSHEVLLKMYNSCCNDRELKNVRSWSFQIAYNVTIDYFKRNGRHNIELIDIPIEDASSAYKDAEIWMEPLIRLLPAEYSEPLLMSDIEGMQQAAVAEKLNLSLTATKSRIQRARKLLKKEIMNCCHIESDDKGNLVSFGVKKSCKPLQEYAAKKNNQ